VQVRNDFHLHTSLSACASREVTAADYVANARRLDLAKPDFSDHFWNTSIARA